MITRDQIVLERLENELNQTWHLLQTTENKQLVYDMIKLVRDKISSIISLQDK
jgi:hypothetical protein